MRDRAGHRCVRCRRLGRTHRLPAGDEPHYLIIAQSLVNDRDLQIENNHGRGGDYHAYFWAELQPHPAARGANGQVYSIPAPGLPMLIAPAFAALGYHGVMILLVVVAAMSSGVAWFAAWRVTGDAAASWFGWATVTLSAPFFFHSFAVYPDGVGAAIVLIGVLPLIHDRARERRALLLVGAALAGLPWLHTRFAILAATLTCVIVSRLATTPRALGRVAAFSAFPFLSAAAWFAFFAAIYGVPNPTAPYGGASQFYLNVLGAGVTGLLFDHQFGLLPNAPAYVCALAGLGVMLAGDQRRLGIELLAVTVPYFLAVAMFPMWWGGFSAPGPVSRARHARAVDPSAVWFRDTPTDGAMLGLGAVLLSACVVAAILSSPTAAPRYSTSATDPASMLAISPVVNPTTAPSKLFQHPPSRVMLGVAVWLLRNHRRSVRGQERSSVAWSGQSLAPVLPHCRLRHGRNVALLAHHRRDRRYS